MQSTLRIEDDPLPLGPSVRREYFKLPEDLALLSAGFGIKLPPSCQRDATVLVFTIECTDRLLDAIPQRERRAQFSAGVLACLKGIAPVNDDLPAEVREWLARLRTVVERHQVSEPFCFICAGLFRNSEAMRATHNHAQFVACAAREGRLMVELLLLILTEISTPDFNHFMRELSEPANLGDKLRDVRRDHALGEIAIQPGLRFHARLVWAMLWRTLTLAGSCVGNLGLVVWGLKSVFTELIWFRFSTTHSH